MTIEQKLQKAYQICNNLSKQYGDDFSVEITINGRLSTTLGRFMFVGTKGDYRPLKIELSKKFLEYATPEDLYRTAAHEWCHYYLTKTTKENHGHNAHFKALAAEVGTNGTTTTEVVGFRDMKEEYKYSCYCNECDSNVANYKSAGAGIVKSKGEGYISKCCDASIRVIKN